MIFAGTLAIMLYSSCSSHKQHQGTNLHLMHWQVNSSSLSQQESSHQFSSVQPFSCPTLCDPMNCSTPDLPTPEVYPNSWPSELVMLSNHLSLCRPFSSCPQSFPATGSFPMSQFFTSGGLIASSIGVSASTSLLPMNTLDWSPSGGTGWISLQSKGLSRFFSNTTVQKHQFFSAQLSLLSNSHIHIWLLEKL